MILATYGLVLSRKWALFLLPGIMFVVAICIVSDDYLLSPVLCFMIQVRSYSRLILHLTKSDRDFNRKVLAYISSQIYFKIINVYFKLTAYWHRYFAIQRIKRCFSYFYVFLYNFIVWKKVIVWRKHWILREIHWFDFCNL